MNLINATKEVLVTFAREEDGAQVVEYALVIALVSIALAVGLSAVAGAVPFSALATRIASCLGGTASC
jgi:Flp pilus assembly pilin Flp